MSNKFFVSVANAVGRDPNTKQAIFYGKTNLTSAFTLAMEANEVRGGVGNAVLYTYMHSRSLNVNIEQVTASETFLALNVGSQIQAGASMKILKTQCVQFNALGVASIEETPIGDRSTITIFYGEGLITIPDSVDAGAKTVTSTACANLKADIVYEYYGDAKVLAVDATRPPNVIDLTLIAQIRDSKNNLVEMFHINIPSYQIDGNYELSFSADGVSQETLSGRALRVDGETCSDGDIYAYIKWVPVAGTSALSIIEIAAIPTSPLVSLTTPVQITTKGLYGGVYAPSTIATGLTYSLQGGVGSAFAVSAGGVVTAKAAVTGTDTDTMTVTYTDGALVLKDYVFITGKA